METSKSTIQKKNAPKWRLQLDFIHLVAENDMHMAHSMRKKTLLSSILQALAFYFQSI